jgi:hypothetical protein
VAHRPAEAAWQGAHARDRARDSAKRLGRQPPASDKPKDYPLADDSFWATDEDEDDPELGLELIQGLSIAHPPTLLAALASRHLRHARTAAAVGQAHAQRQRLMMRTQVSV